MTFQRKPNWQISAARLEGMIPFISEGLDEILALRSIRRTWKYFARDYPFDHGLLHQSSVEQSEIMRSWHGAERCQLLSLLLRAQHPVVAGAVKRVMAAKNYEPVEANSEFLLPIEALDKLKEIRPILSPLITLEDWIRKLRDDPAYLEIREWQTEIEAREKYEHIAHGMTELNEAHRPESSFWAAGVAAAMYPALFGMARAPLLVPGVTSKLLFRQEPEVPLSEALVSNLNECLGEMQIEAVSAAEDYKKAKQALSDVYSSSHAFAAWRFAYGIGPVTRLEIGRMLDVTHKTAYNVTQTLIDRNLAELDSDKVIRARTP